MKRSLVRYYRIPLIYLLFSVAWIFGSDLIVNVLYPNPKEILLLSVIKGTCFVLLSTLLIYILLKEDERRQAATRGQLEQSRKSFADLFENNPLPMLVYAREGFEILAINSKAESIFGYSPEQYHAMKTLDLLSPSDQEIYIQSVLNGEVLNRETGPWHLIKKNGEEIFSKVFSVPIQIGETPAIIASVLDTGEYEEVVTELKKVQKEKDEIESFSYSVSHDLKAPLRAITGYSAVLLEDYRDRLDETGAGYLQSLRKNAEKMNQLIEDLLRLAKVDYQEMRYHRINLSTLFEEVCSSLQANEPDRKVEWVIEPEVKVVADDSLMRIAFQNLAGNAFKFTRGKELTRIEFGKKRSEGDGVEVYFVRDNGVGFSMEDAGQLFMPFKTLHKPGEFEGTGIGLTIVKRIIQRHNGEIWVESKPGEGAVFYFTLHSMRDRKIG